MALKIKTKQADTAKAIEQKYTAEQINNGRIRNAAIEELIKTGTPDNIYYSANNIKAFLSLFILADTNLDGHITLKELLDMLEYFKFDEEIISASKAIFEKSDVSEDQKVSLAGAIAHFSLLL
ncbi:uncharacterized protein N7506_007521 [Penicillium brevicompactum]|uniref:uncharacterized protein n=1 Tax=Penicillium brevicompactum TaxID=5074 RepID=UPI00254162AA|nr:uncharacterized protein N7506_007521 [Penicillium brevicompactum]KAJ5333738.1 hypothetical protein N7506_007521 [Penicillium brevicompactum]